MRLTIKEIRGNPRRDNLPSSPCNSATTGNGDADEKGEGEPRCGGGLEVEEQGVDSEGVKGLVVETEEQEAADSRPRSPPPTPPPFSVQALFTSAGGTGDSASQKFS